jgi:hypothetical protein
MINIAIIGKRVNNGALLVVIQFGAPRYSDEQPEGDPLGPESMLVDLIGVRRLFRWKRTVMAYFSPDHTIKLHYHLIIPPLTVPKDESLDVFVNCVVNRFAIGDTESGKLACQNWRQGS